MLLLQSLKPTGFTVASIVVAFGGFLNGFDTGSVGAVTVMPQFRDTVGSISPTVVGVTISMILLTGAVPSLFAGQLADRYGRLAVISAGAAGFGVGSMLQATSYTLGQFIAGRAIAGLGEGSFLGVMNVYICEIAPSKRRGRLASIPQLLCAVGICLGYFTCYGTVKLQTSSMAWRTPFIIATVVSVFLASGCYFIPHSPRWLMQQGRRDEAIQAVEWLGIQQAEAEKDILCVGSEDMAQESSGMVKTMITIFTRKYRSRTVLALFILGMVQLCGIDGVLYYAPTLFSQAGLPEQTAGFLASGISAVLICAISIPAAMFADRWGRRTSIIVGGIGLSGTMFLVGIMYAAKAVHRTGTGRWIVIISIFAFALIYAATWAMVGKIYASEIQPGHTRAASNSLAQGLGFFTNGLVALITPIFLANSAYGAYFLFGGLSFSTLVVLTLYMPETRGEPLESIQDVFSKPLRLHGIPSAVRRLVHSSVPSEAGSLSGGSSTELADIRHARAVHSLASAV
ncbi:hypothetical protein LTR85_010895 [Meristemomyces frigidus]|nr:hypothetical protein LTR85_010895 [Meristemomyces frigidus]